MDKVLRRQARILSCQNHIIERTSEQIGVLDLQVFSRLGTVKGLQIKPRISRILTKNYLPGCEPDNAAFVIIRGSFLRAG